MAATDRVFHFSCVFEVQSIANAVNAKSVAVSLVMHVRQLKQLQLCAYIFDQSMNNTAQQKLSNLSTLKLK